MTWSQAMLMMAPPPCARIRSTAAQEARIVPRRSTASTRSSFWSRSSRPALAGENVGPGVVDPDIDSAEGLLEALDQRVDVLPPADVGADHLDPASEGPDLRGGGLCAGLIPAVGKCDVGPGPRAPERDGATDSARRSGNQDDLVVQHSAASPPNPAGDNFLNPNISAPYRLT